MSSPFGRTFTRCARSAMIFWKCKFEITVCINNYIERKFMWFWPTRRRWNEPTYKFYGTRWPYIFNGSDMHFHISHKNIGYIGTNRVLHCRTNSTYLKQERETETGTSGSQWKQEVIRWTQATSDFQPHSQTQWPAKPHSRWHGATINFHV